MPPTARTWSIAACTVSAPLECDSGVTQTVQSQDSPPPPSGGHSRRQSVSVSGKVTKPSRA